MNIAINSPLLDSVFTALAHKKRRGILHTLSFRPATITQLADEHGLSLQAIHKHLRVLDEAELILRKKAGRTNFVALKKSSLQGVQGWLNQYHSEWGNDKETLENYIASLDKG